MKRWLFIVLILIGVSSSSHFARAEDAAAESRIPNGNFESSKDETPVGWPKATDNVSYPVEDGNHFLRLKTTEPGQNLTVYKLVTLKPEDKAFELTFRVRYDDIRPGVEKWYDGRLIVNFKDANNKIVKGGPNAPHWKGTNATWTEGTLKFKVPEGAVSMEVMPSLIKPETGQIDFDDFKLIAVDPEKVSLAAPGFDLPLMLMADAGPLIDNGDFESQKGGTPVGWIGENSDTVSGKVEDGNHFIRLRSTEPGKMIMLYHTVQISGDPKALELTFRARYEGIKRGEKLWNDGRIIMNFKDADGNKLSSPGAPAFKGSSKGEWKQVSKKFLVPDGAKTLELMPTLFNVAAGTLDIDDLKLTPIDPNSIPKPIEMTSPVVEAPPADKLPAMLRVVGNHLETPDGKAVWMQGLCVDSLQWSPTGDRIVQSINVAIDQWHANVIRLPVTEDFWFGRGGHDQEQADGGARYREVIDSAINTAAMRGAHVVIDLHRFRAPNENTLQFWKDFAEKYKNHPAVMFELFNEPHGISWEIWRNGGEVTDKVKPKEGVVAENNEALKTFTAIGMQQLVDAVRATGAKNVIIAGGLDWSYDLTGILDGFALEEKGGNGIVYSTHVYPWKKGWQKHFIDAAEKYPLFVGEVGCIRAWEDFSFIPPSQQKEVLGPECTWSQDMLGVIQKYKLNWTAFSFHPRCGPMVVSDWNYTRTTYWGVFAKRALAGEAFETQKLR